MRINVITVLCLLLAACSGRCHSSDAVHDTVPGGICHTDAAGSWCVLGDRLIACTIKGRVTSIADCRLYGTITIIPGSWARTPATAEKP